MPQEPYIYHIIKKNKNNFLPANLYGTELANPIMYTGKDSRNQIMPKNTRRSLFRFALLTIALVTPILVNAQTPIKPVTPVYDVNILPESRLNGGTVIEGGQVNSVEIPESNTLTLWLSVLPVVGLIMLFVRRRKPIPVRVK